MYKKIVVPVDLAHTDKAAVMIETAKKLAGENAQIFLTNIVEEMPPHFVPELPGEYIEKSKSIAIKEMK
jgi:hypothetical protein